MVSSIRDWLQSLDLGRYAETFEANDLDLDLAADLSDADLKDLGVTSMGHRKNLLRAIDGLRAASTTENGQREAAATPGKLSSTAPATPAQAERRQLTVMFCDLVGSTELSTRLDPEDLQEVIRAYHDSCAKAIAQYNGYIAKFMGDGVLAYFGYPQAHENDAERAARAGLDIVGAMANVSAAQAPLREMEMAVRIGINTGLVVVGDIIGEGAAEEASVVGETPNVAAQRHPHRGGAVR